MSRRKFESPERAVGEPMKEWLERYDRARKAFNASQPALQDTPVNVRGAADDRELDDHVWLRLSALTGEDHAEIATLPVDQRAYYVTRAYEREVGSGGPTGFLDWYGPIGPLIAAGYRHLGLAEAAAAFEAFWSSSVTQRLLVDPDDQPSPAETATHEDLASEVGEHDADRIAFIRAHPDSFSI